MADETFYDDLKEAWQTSGGVVKCEIMIACLVMVGILGSPIWLAIAAVVIEYR